MNNYSNFLEIMCSSKLVKIVHEKDENFVAHVTFKCPSLSCNVPRFG